MYIIYYYLFQLSVRWSRPIAATDAYDTAIEDALQNVLFASRSNSSGAYIHSATSSVLCMHLCIVIKSP